MSKLAIVLCATIFFASTLVECGETSDGRELQLQAQTAKRSIENRLREVHDKVYTLGSQPSKINFEIIQELKEHVADHMDEIRNLAELNMNLRSVKYNESECMRRYIAYEALATSVVKNLDNCVTSVTFSTLESLGKTIAAATETMKKIDVIEKWAPQCEGFWCDYVNTTVASTANNTLKSLKEALDDYETLANGSSVREAAHRETDYELLMESEDAFWNEFLKCLTTSSDSTTPAV